MGDVIAIETLKRLKKKPIDLDRRFGVRPTGDAFVRELQARWDALPEAAHWHTGPMGKIYQARPEDPGIGPDCLAWRRKIAKGEPLFKLARATSTRKTLAATLAPLDTVWVKRARKGRVPIYDHAGKKRIGVRFTFAWETSTYKAGASDDGRTIYKTRTWVPDPTRAAPVRVRCPQCRRPIRLSQWWEHGCEKAIVETGPAFGDFQEITAGAAEAVYEDDVASSETPSPSVPAPDVTVVTPPAPAGSPWLGDVRLPDRNLAPERIHGELRPKTKPPHRATCLARLDHEGVRFEVQQNRTGTRFWFIATHAPSFTFLVDYASTTSERIAGAWVEALTRREASEPSHRAPRHALPLEQIRVWRTEGLSYAAIAANLGVHPNAVRRAIGYRPPSRKVTSCTP